MRGTLYAATEIIVFLLIATFIGVLLGRLWATATSRSAPAEAAREPVRATAPVDEQRQSEARVELNRAQEQLSAAQGEIEELRKQLSVTEWQVSTLEEELAKGGAPDGAE